MTESNEERGGTFQRVGLFETEILKMQPEQHILEGRDLLVTALEGQIKDGGSLLREDGKYHKGAGRWETTFQNLAFDDRQRMIAEDASKAVDFQEVPRHYPFRLITATPCS